MKVERLLLIIILITIAVRYLWAVYGLGGQFLLMFPVLISCMALLIYYYLQLTQPFYKITIIYFALFLISIFFNILEWRGRGILLFIGSLGFILFPVYFFLIRRKEIHRNIFKYSLLFLLVLVSQTFIYLFMPADLLLTVGHMLSFPVILLAATLLFKGEFTEETTHDEKKILTFIIIASVLSMLGITFKENFYYYIWL